jgi:hypothetical protein
LPLGADGSGVRFPLSGAVEQGSSPVAYAHGQAFNPVTPFDLASLDNHPPDTNIIGRRRHRRSVHAPSPVFLNYQRPRRALFPEPLIYYYYQ